MRNASFAKYLPLEAAWRPITAPLLEKSKLAAHINSIRSTDSYTPPKINIEPENDGLEDVSPFPGVHSQVPC